MTLTVATITIKYTHEAFSNSSRSCYVCVKCPGNSAHNDRTIHRKHNACFSCAWLEWLPCRTIQRISRSIFFGAVITSLTQELFMSSWKSPERGSNMLRIKCWRMKKLYVQMHWHQSLLMVISNVSGKKSKNTTPATWLTVTEYKMKLGPRILPIYGMIIISNCSIQWMIQMTSLMFCPILGIILIPLMPWLPFMIRYVPSKSFLTTNLLDMMAWCPSISSMHHIVCMSWWQLFYSQWWNMVFFLNNSWQLCLFQFWKTRMVTLQANQIIGQLLCLQWHPKSWR